MELRPVGRLYSHLIYNLVVRMLLIDLMFQYLKLQFCSVNLSIFPVCPRQDQQMLNRQVFVDTFAACCHDNRPASASPPDGGPEPERTGAMTSRLARSLAVMFIELVSPDIMYNGIPWPEEEFMKVTMERCVKCGNDYECGWRITRGATQDWGIYQLLFIALVI